MTSQENTQDTSHLPTEIQAIETAHEQLIVLVNDLSELFLQGADRKELLAIVDELLSYGQTHLEDEEKYMEQRNKLMLTEHQTMHREWISNVKELRNQIDLQDFEVSPETIHYIQKLIDSIEQIDPRNYGLGVRSEIEHHSVDEEFPEEWFFQSTLLILPEDAFVAFVSREGVATYVRKTARFPLAVSVGSKITDPIIRDTVTAKAWNDRKRTVQEGDPSLFGVAYESVSNPIYWNEQFAGVLSVVVEVSHTQEFKDGFSVLIDQTGVLDNLAHDLAEAGTQFAQNTDHIASAVQQLQDHARELEEINTLISEVAAQTNLLGLNAAIEAARAGDLGRGFGVVAEEIRRLSTMVKDSSKQVRDKVQETVQAIHAIQRSVEEETAASEEQAAQLQELSVTITHMHQTTENLKKLS